MRTVYNPPKAICFILLAWLFMAFNTAAIKEVSSSLSSYQILFWLGLFCWILTLPFVLKEGLGNLKTKHPFLHLFRDLTGATCFLLMYLAVRYLPMMDTLLLFNASALFIPFVVFFWRGVRIASRVWLVLLIGFLGIILILHPGPEIFRPASLIAILSAVASSFSLVAMRRLLLLKEPISRILFYLFLVMSLIGLPALFFDGFTLSAKELLAMGGAALFMMGAQYSLSRAYRYWTASNLAPLNYSVVIFAGLIDWIVWHVVPTWFSIVGTLVVILGGLTDFLLSRREVKRK